MPSVEEVEVGDYITYVNQWGFRTQQIIDIDGYQLECIDGIGEIWSTSIDKVIRIEKKDEPINMRRYEDRYQKARQDNEVIDLIKEGENQ